MSRRLPPLNALRAFEAAARHLSFLKASEELHVTPGAVSQQVRALEAQLGVALFRRLTRGVLLTDAGQRYGRRMAELFDAVEAATRELKRTRSPKVLTVSAMPSFAARWLIPRLGSFRLGHPEIELRVLAEGKLTDFAVDEIDAVIRFGGGAYPGLVSELLFAEEIFPVCSPALAAGPPPLLRLEDLAGQTLLHDDPDPGYRDMTWQRWLAAVGAAHIAPGPGLLFNYTHMSLQAAAAGQGVALGSSVLAGDDLASGKLVRPLAESIPSDFAYWFVSPPAQAELPRVAAFRTWLGEESRRFRSARALA